MLNLTPEQISKLPPEEVARLFEVIEGIQQRSLYQEAAQDFWAYNKLMLPGFEPAQHSRLLIETLQKVERGEIKRLCLSMPRRHGKSEIGSVRFPEWYMARNPNREVLISSYSGNLAEDFGRKIRNSFRKDQFKAIFPNVGLSQDSQSAQRFELTNGSKLYAVGMGGSAIGRGAHLAILDDLFSSRQDADSEATRRAVQSFYTSVVRPAVYPGGAIIIINTRWRDDDLIGYVLSEATHENWTVLKLPALLDDNLSSIFKRERGTPLWPERYTAEELDAIRLSIPSREWAAMFMQEPKEEGGNILKSQWWRKWGDGQPPDFLDAEQRQAWVSGDPPSCLYVLQTWDTAFSTKETADYSACTTWGIFQDRNDAAHAIILGAFQERLEFPMLVERAIELGKEWQPDNILIEDKASGQSLIQELSHRGVYVSKYRPDKDKIVRAHAASAPLEAGKVWAPKRRWAEEVIDQCAAFPSGPHDDVVDCVTMALIRFREGRWVDLYNDEKEEPAEPSDRKLYW